MRNLKKVPTVLVLVAIWALVRFLGLATPMASVWAWILLIACFAAIVYEFYKSSDITVRSFAVDLGFAVLAMAMVSISLTLLWQYRSWFLIDVIVFATAFIDGYVSPMNSFRCAQRNLQGGIGDQTMEEHPNHHGG